MRSGPATSSSLSKTWLRITGKDSWELTDATVFSCDWADLPDQIDSLVGHYHVVYSYQVDGTFYTGRFADYGMQNEEYFKRNDVFQWVTRAVLSGPNDRNNGIYRALCCEAFVQFLLQVFNIHACVKIDLDIDQIGGADSGDSYDANQF